MAADNGIATIAFPAISTGAYGFPAERAAPIAVAAVRASLAAHPAIRAVTLVCFSADAAAAYRAALAA